MTRRSFLATLGVVGCSGVLGEAFVVEPRWLDVTHHRVHGGAAPQLTLALLADLHLKKISSLEENVAEVVRSAQPDLVVLAGDSLDERGKLGVLDAFLALLPREAATYAILGNWEYEARVDRAGLRAVYARHGIRLLVNESTHFERGGRRVHVTGFDDAKVGRPRLDALPKRVRPGAFNLALEHSPVFRDRLVEQPAARQPDLVLAGHTHGGQCDLFGWKPFLPRGCGRYVEGWYGRGSADEDSPMYVSRGIGTSGLPARLGARPEVALFRL